MEKKDLQSLKPIYPLYVQKYNDFIPKPENENFISKLNSVIDYLTRIGSLNNQTVKQWNEVMKWITEEGLENITEEEVVKQFESYKEEVDSISGELGELKSDVEQAKQVSKEAKQIGDTIKVNGDEAKTKGDYAKLQGDYAKDQAIKSEQQYNRLKDTDVGTLSAELDESNKKVKRQRELLALFYLKIMRKLAVVLVSQGDSMTYGYDTVSPDKRPSPSGAVRDDGISITTSRASITYPEALQGYLRDVYNHNNITVINKGFEGDYASNSYDHWGKNSNADLALIMLGTNDSNLGATYVPSDIRGNIVRYMEDMRKIIDRYTRWGTAVILLTPPRLRNQENPETTSSHNTEPYRHAIKLLSEEYGVPMVDSESFLNGCDYTYYSDGVHLNGKGYQYFASRLTSVLVGYGVKNPVRLKGGDTLSIRSTRDNFVRNSGVQLLADPASTGPEEELDGRGLLANLTSGGTLTYGFETLEDNLILIPIYGLGNGGIAETTLDFGNEQGSVPLLSAVHSGLPQGIKPLSVVSSTVSTTGDSAYTGAINVSTTDRYIHITNKGWHNIKIKNSHTTGNVYFNGFVVLSFEDFKSREVSPWTTFTPTVKGVTVAGSHNYTLQLGRFRYDKKSKTTFIQIAIDCTLDNTIDGNIFIGTNLDVNSRPSIISPALSVADIRGFRSDNSPINARIAANTSDVYIQYQESNGNHGYINGNTIRDKRVSIVLSGSFITS